MTTRASLLSAVLLPALAIAADAATYKVDPVHSAVVFRVKHMNTSYAYGRFNGVSGSFSLDPADPARSSFDFTIKTETIDTGNPARDTHLKNADFFNAKQYGTITFKSKKVASAGKDTYEVTGDLTMHGMTRPVTVTIEHTGSGKDMRGNAIAGIESVFTLKRSDYGMKGMLEAIGDDVKVMLSAEGGAK